MSDTPHSLLEQLHREPEDSLAWSRMFDQEHDRVVYQELLRLGQEHFHEEQWRIFERVAVREESPDAVALAHGTTRNAVYLIKSRVLHWLRTTGEGLIER